MPPSATELKTRICTRNSPLTTLPFSGFTMETIGAPGVVLPSATNGPLGDCADDGTPAS